MQHLQHVRCVGSGLDVLVAVGGSGGDVGGRGVEVGGIGVLLAVGVELGVGDGWRKATGRKAGAGDSATVGVGEGGSVSVAWMGEDDVGREEPMTPTSKTNTATVTTGSSRREEAVSLLMGKPL